MNGPFRRAMPIIAVLGGLSGLSGLSGLGTMGALLVFAGCNPALAGEDKAAGAAAEVVVATPKRQTITRDIEVAGTLEPWSRALIRPKISGFVEKLEVDIGSIVKQGDVLAFVAVAELDAEFDAAKARAAAERVRAVGAGSLGKVSQKRFSRLAQLYKGAPETVAADRVDAAQTHALRNANVKAHAEALERAGQAEQRRAELVRDYQVIKAPFDGVVSQRFVDIGDLVHPADSKGMFEVLSQGKLRARFALPEGAAMRVTSGTTGVTISVPAAPSNPATLAMVSRSSGAVDPQTRTVTFEADIDKPAERWIPGLYAKIMVELLRKENALTLPAKALVPSKGGSSVWLCTKGVAHMVAITLGVDDGAVIEVLSGVDDSATVVLKGHDGLAEGGACRAQGKGGGK